MGEEGKVILRHFETPQGVSSEARHKSPLFCEVPPLPGSSEAVNGANRQILEPPLGHVPRTVGNSSPKLIWGICQEFGGSPTHFQSCNPSPVCRYSAEEWQSCQRLTLGWPAGLLPEGGGRGCHCAGGAAERWCPACVWRPGACWDGALHLGCPFALPLNSLRFSPEQTASA